MARLPEAARVHPAASPLETAGPDYRASVTYNADDLARGQYLFFRTHLKRRKTLRAYAMLWMLGLAFYAWLLWPLTGTGWWVLLVLALVMPVVIVGTPWLIVRLTARWSARRALRGQMTLAGEHTFAWTPERFAMVSRYGTSDVPWPDFRGTAENERLWLLFVSDRMYYVVPKRALTPEQRDTFHQCLTQGRAHAAHAPDLPPDVPPDVTR